MRPATSRQQTPTATMAYEKKQNVTHFVGRFHKVTIPLFITSVHSRSRTRASCIFLITHRRRKCLSLSVPVCASCNDESEREGSRDRETDRQIDRFVAQEHIKEARPAYLLVFPFERQPERTAALVEIRDRECDTRGTPNENCQTTDARAPQTQTQKQMQKRRSERCDRERKRANKSA